MRVWVVCQADFDSDGPLSVWSTREGAEAELARMKQESPHFKIEELEVDEPFCETSTGDAA